MAGGGGGAPPQKRRNEYDTAGRVIRQTQADGGEFAFAYTLDGAGKITHTDVTNPRGVVRRVTFNGDGYDTSDTAALGTALEQGTTFSRLAGSQLIETETDALGRVTGLPTTPTATSPA